VFFFAPEILSLWVHDSQATQHVTPILRMLILGTGLNGILNVPYALQLAYGWIRFAFYAHAVSMIVSLGLLYWMVAHFGPVGVASVWLISNIGLLGISLPLMHLRLLRGEFGGWIWNDVSIPFLAAIVPAALWRYAMPASLLTSRVMLIASLAFISAATLMASVLLTSFTRKWFWDHMHRGAVWAGLLKLS